MKKNEIALLVVIVGIAVMVSYAIVNSIVGSSGSLKPYAVKTVQPISSEVKAPSSEIFSSSSYNPTVKVKIGDQANQQVFSGQ